MKQRIVEYRDERNDEFSGVGERRKVSVGADFPYVRKSLPYRVGRFLLYRGLITPVAFLYCHFRFRIKFVGKEKIKPYKRTGYFLYGNHTQIPGDGFFPNLISFPQDTYVIVNPDNIAARGTQTLMQMLGAVPTPTELGGFRPFNQTVEQRIREGNCVAIYPEAHIWPYYTGIRPFSDTSFRFPAKNGAPVFCFTVTYRRSKRGHPRVVIYVDGPFCSAAENARTRQKELREMVYHTMTERASVPENYPFVLYKPAKEIMKEEET